jgi:hypothetical protein
MLLLMIPDDQYASLLWLEAALRDGWPPTSENMRSPLHLARQFVQTYLPQVPILPVWAAELLVLLEGPITDWQLERILVLEALHLLQEQQRP